MKKIVFLITFAFSTCAVLYAQDFTDAYKSCYPQKSPMTIKLFDFLKEVGVLAVESSYLQVDSQGTQSSTTSVLLRDETVLLSVDYINDNEDEIHEVTLFNSNGLFQKRSDYPEMGLPADRFTQVTMKDLFYPDSYLAYMSADSLAANDLILGILSSNVGSGVLERGVLEDKIKTVLSFLAKTGEDSEQLNLDINGAKVKIKASKRLIEEFLLETPEQTIVVANKFIYDSKEIDEDKFRQRKYYPIFDYSGNPPSFGFTVEDCENGKIIKFTDEWSQYLYGAHPSLKFSEHRLKTINGKNIELFDLKQFNEEMLSNMDSIKISFEGLKEEFVFKKVSKKDQLIIMQTRSVCDPLSFWKSEN